MTLGRFEALILEDKEQSSSTAPRRDVHLLLGLAVIGRMFALH